MSEKSPNIPHYSIHLAGTGPREVTIDSDTQKSAAYILSRVVAITPAFDPPDGFFANLTSKFVNEAGSPEVGINALHKVAADEALLLEIAVPGRDEVAHDKLRRVIDGLSILINPWDDPDRFIDFLYTSPQKYKIGA